MPGDPVDLQRLDVEQLGNDLDSETSKLGELDETVLAQLEEGQEELSNQILEDSEKYSLIRTLSEQAVEELVPGTDFDAETLPDFDTDRYAEILEGKANEAGLDAKDIGRINIFDSFSTVDLPTGMPPEIFKDLKNTWISKKKINITHFTGDLDAEAAKSRNADVGDRPLRKKPKSKTKTKTKAGASDKMNDKAKKRKKAKKSKKPSPGKASPN